MMKESTPHLSSLRTWLAEDSALGRSVDGFFAELAERLRAHGLPLWRLSTTLHTLDPEIAGEHLVWTRGRGSHLIARPHEQLGTSTYLGSPTQAIIEGKDEIHCRVDVPAEQLLYPVLAELKQEGATDYLILPLDIREGLPADTGHPYRQRCWISFTTDTAEGFSTEQLALLRGLLPAMSLRMSLELSKHAARRLLRAYLGPNATRRILAGAFRRGTAEAIWAVIWYCDLRGFTSLSDVLPARDVVSLLDQYFDAVATPIGEHGGEVLKFIGDAVLAIFPVEAEAEQTCAKAMWAAQDAQQNVEALNRHLAAQGRAPVDFGLALHLGEVMYGNIGAKNRLDFTVIGAPVNEACRVEALTRPLNARVLLTREFVEAGRVKGATSLGRHALKGVGEPKEVFAPR